MESYHNAAEVMFVDRHDAEKSIILISNLLNILSQVLYSISNYFCKNVILKSGGERLFLAPNFQSHLPINLLKHIKNNSTQLNYFILTMSATYLVLFMINVIQLKLFKNTIRNILNLDLSLKPDHEINQDRRFIIDLNFLDTLETGPKYRRRTDSNYYCRNNLQSPKISFPQSPRRKTLRPFSG